MNIKTNTLVDKKILYKPQSITIRLQKFPVTTETYYINGINLHTPWMEAAMIFLYLALIIKRMWK